MSVKVRTLDLAEGKKMLFIDIYHEGKRKKEYLKLYLYPDKSALTTQKNKETLAEAKEIAHKRALELSAIDYNVEVKHKKNVDFVEYFTQFADKYPNKDKRLVTNTLKKFIEFLAVKNISSLTAKQLSEQICKEFKKFLDNHLNGETPYNYFSKFKRVVNQAITDKIINDNPNANVRNTKALGLKKEILNIDEIRKLSAVDVINGEVRRAFFFCLNTGLRYCDVKVLQWKNIDNDRLILSQSKVQHSSQYSQIINDLNNTALSVLGTRGRPDALVFNLPTLESCLISLKKWAAAAGIDKNITWHSARHSFAVNLLTGDVGGANIKTVSALLGHSSLKHTEKYTRVIDEQKSKAIHNLPDMVLVSGNYMKGKKK
ncbi:MAG: site-specific integrase [Candidatus Kapabacteria bacterium]|nr:site-specific integrase [Candidatus Kapabacteria bacterium]